MLRPTALVRHSSAMEGMNEGHGSYYNRQRPNVSSSEYLSENYTSNAGKLKRDLQRIYSIRHCQLPMTKPARKL